MDAQRRVDPRIRAHGRARIDITRNAKDEADWRRRWKAPKYEFPFKWGEGWVHSIEYKVDDFAAEVGFFIDVLALPVAAFSPSYAFFSGPNGEFTFGVVAVEEGEVSTLPDTLRLQFNVKNILETVEELETRGVEFGSQPYPAGLSDQSLHTTYFRTPHGICIDLLGSAIEDQSYEEDSEETIQEVERTSENYSRDASLQDDDAKRSNGGLPFRSDSHLGEFSRDYDESTQEDVDDSMDGEESYGQYSINPELEPFTSDEDKDIDDEDENDVGGYSESNSEETRSGALENQAHRKRGKWNSSSGRQRKSISRDRSLEIKYVQLDDPYLEDKP